jgi:F-type H+-transporting ATPase subunit alpha
MSTLTEKMKRWSASIHPQIAEHDVGPHLEQVGRVEQIGDGVATVTGLPETGMNELLRFDDGTLGIAYSLNNHDVGSVLLGPDTDIVAGSRVRCTGNVVRTPVGEALLSRVIDPLGRVLDGGPMMKAITFEPIEKPAPAIVDRDLVQDPLITGLLVVDAMIPLGLGQRQLIIGDRGTGKTAVAIDTMISQKDTDVICIYVAVGQNASSINQVVQSVEQYGSMEQSIFVVAEAAGPMGLQWIAPFAACTMAEYFVEAGRNVLIIFDDLTKHAGIHRQISLLLRNIPGREAYPGDVFYLHARLLERSAKLSEELGGGSLTALPIVETLAGNLSGYIPTNLISITDGQLYLDKKLFNAGMKPAIDVGKSVSRVGGRTQAPAIKALAESLRLEYAQFLELEIFTRFSVTADAHTMDIIDHGRIIRAILAQSQYHPIGLSAQTALLLALHERLFDELSPEQVSGLRKDFLLHLSQHCTLVMDRIEKTQDLIDEDREALFAATKQYILSKFGNFGAEP